MPIMALSKGRCDGVEAHGTLNRGENRLHCGGEFLVVQRHRTAAQVRVAGRVQVRIPQQQTDVVNLRLHEARHIGDSQAQNVFAINLSEEVDRETTFSDIFSAENARSCR